MKKKKCRKCGGTRRADGGCNLCEMFADAAAPAGDHGQGYPIASEALAIDPKQRARMMEIDKKMGAPVTHYDHYGRPLLTSRGHRHQYLKAHKAHDRNSFTGH